MQLVRHEADFLPLLVLEKAHSAEGDFENGGRRQTPEHHAELFGIRRQTHLAQISLHDDRFDQNSRQDFDRLIHSAA